MRSVDFQSVGVVTELLGHREVVPGDPNTRENVRISIGALEALITSNQGPTYATRAELFADLDWVAHTMGYVAGDTVENRGAYKKQGSAGGGSWVKIGPLPESFVDLAALNDRVTALEEVALGDGNFVVSTEPEAIDLNLSTALNNKGMTPLRTLQQAREIGGVLPDMVGNVTGTAAQQTDAFQAWATEIAGGEQGVIKRGHYLINDLVDLRSELDMRISLDGFPLFDSSDSTLNDFHFKGGAGYDATEDLPALASDITAGAMLIAFATAPDLSSGDVFLICDEDDFSWYPEAFGGRDYYLKGEVCVVRDRAGSTVYLSAPLADSYAAADNLTIVKLTLPHFEWSGGCYFKGPGGTSFAAMDALTFSGGLLVEQARPMISDVRGEGHNFGPVSARRCAFGQIVRPRNYGPLLYSAVATPSSGYGVMRLACTEVDVIDPWLVARKHADAMHGGSIPLSIPNRNCFTRGGYLKGGWNAGDQHGGCANTGWIGTRIDGGVLIGGRGVLIDGCHISGGYGTMAGRAITDGELASADVVIRNTLLEANGAHPLAALINIEGEKTFEGGKFDIEDLRLKTIPGAPPVTAISIVWTDILGSDMDVHLGSLKSDTETAPLVHLEFDATSDGKCRNLVVDKTYQLSPRLEGRFEHGKISGVKSRKGVISGIQLALHEHSAKQLIEIEGASISEAEQAGIRIEGPGSTEDIEIVFGAEVKSLNNNQQDTPPSSTLRNSLRVLNVGRLSIPPGMVLGDSQSSPTQGATYNIDGVGTLILRDPTIIGTLAETRANITAYGRGSVLRGSKTHDFASISANSFGISTTVTVTGAAVGDRAFAVLSTNPGIRLDATITAANTATVDPYNPTGSSQDPSSGTLTVFVIKS